MQTQQLKKEFANGLNRILALTRVSLHAESASFYWVNRTKEQFVLASESHDSGSLSCLQRTPFAEHYLVSFTELDQLLVIDEPQAISTFRNSNFFQTNELALPNFKQLILFPIQSQKQTIAIILFAVQQPIHITPEHLQKIFATFYDLYSLYFSMSGTLNELRAEQELWNEYDQQLDEMIELSVSKKSSVQLLQQAMYLLNCIVTDRKVESTHQKSSDQQNKKESHKAESHSANSHAGLIFATQSAGEWIVVSDPTNSTLFSNSGSATGFRIEPHTLAMNALESGKTEFIVHANPSPYRFSSQESPAKGASLAIPLLYDGRRSGLFLFTHSNPRFFTDTIQHKLSNLVRQLSIQLALGLQKSEEPLYTDHSLVLQSEMWQHSVQQWMESNPDSTARLMFVTPKQLPTLRARYRLEELRSLQTEMGNLLSPHRAGLMGWVGRYSEYVFVVLIMDTGFQKSEEEGGKPLSDSTKKHTSSPQHEIVENYKAVVNKAVETGLAISEHQSIPIQFHFVSASNMTSASLPKVIRELNSELTFEVSKNEE